jgi:hypothetical protein
MINLELDLGLNTNVGNYLHLLTKKGIFPNRAESYEFSMNSATLLGVHRIDAMSFRFAYSSCGYCKQACEYVADENLMNFRWWDKPMHPPMVLVQVGVTLRHPLPT